MRFGLFFVLSCCISVGLQAEDTVKQEIQQGLSKLLPDMQIESIRPTPVDGLYQVILGPDIIYMTRDGKYVLKGDLLDIEQRRNLTEDVRAETRVTLLESIKPEEIIEFKAEDVEDAIYVFTDIDCGYCRKLHQDVPELNARGVSVRYLAYPRAGVDSATAKEMASVWCAENKQDAMTRAKNRERIESRTCNNPVASQHELGRKMGVRGTPAIYLQNGKAIPGYMPPDRLIEAMGR